MKREKFKDNIAYLTASTQITMNEMKEGILNPTKKTKVVSGIVLSFIMALMCISFAFADGNGDNGALKGKIVGSLNSVYGIILGVTTAVMVVCVAGGLLLAMLTSNQQKTAKYLDFVKKAVIIWVAIMLISTIVNFVYKAFFTEGNNDLGTITKNNGLDNAK